MTGGHKGITNDSQDIKTWSFPSGPSASISRSWVNGFITGFKSVYNGLSTYMGIRDNALDLYENQTFDEPFPTYGYRYNRELNQIQYYDTIHRLKGRIKYREFKRDSAKIDERKRYHENLQKAHQLR